MANPNLINVSSVLGANAGFNLTNTATATLITVASDKLVKINRITCANVDGTNSATVTVTHYDGSNDRHIAKGITVPAGATVVLIDKNSFLYLEENHSIRGGASAASDLEILICYEELS